MQMGKKRFWSRALCAAVIATTAMTSAASAAVTYSYEADAPTYTASDTTTPVVVKVYLKETLTGTSTSLLAANGGLQTGGVAIARKSGTETITAVTQDVVDFTGPVGTDLAPSQADLSVATGPTQSAGVPRGNTGGGISPATKATDVYLGSFTLTGGGGTFTVGPIGTSGSNTFDNVGNDLDLTSTNPAFTGAADPTVLATPFTFTVSVPEPVSGAGLMLIGAALTARRARRKVTA